MTTGLVCNETDAQDRIAWALCQIIDDDAPLYWTRYRYAAFCIATNHKLMLDLCILRDESKEKAQ